jgi:Protein of unknown function (DUF2281)
LEIAGGKVKIKRYKVESQSTVKTMNNIQQSVLGKLLELPPDKQEEVLDFVEFLHQKTIAKQPRQSLKGLWSTLELQVSEEDITAARREMWGDFPTGDF